MTTAKEALWQRYYAAIKAGKRTEAKEILNKIHNSGPHIKPRSASSGGCGRCNKRFN